jgi:hypothetical protein
LIKLSRSCGQTIALKSRKHTHCGVCSQCLDRRFAVLAADQEANDPASNYAVDLLVGDRGEGDPKTMLAGYLELVDRVSEMGEPAFLTHFGELARALPHLDPPVEVAAARVFALYQRHARQVAGVVDREIAANIRDLRRRRFPESCLLRIAYDDGTVPPAPEPLLTAANYFVRRGECWLARFNGGEPNTILPSKGAAYLRILLSQPHKPVSAARLACLVAGHPAEYALGNAGEVLDREALAAYRTRRAELIADIDLARDQNDAAALRVAEAELAALNEEIGSAMGLGGKVRIESDDADRVRKAVGNAIRRAVEHIAVYDQLLADHLQPPQLTCGRCPCYRPGSTISWEV